SYYPHYAVNFGYGWGWPYGYRYAALYSTCYDPFFYDPFLCYDPIFARPYGYGFYGYGFYGYRYRPFYGGGYSFSNRPHNLFINRVRNGTGVQMYFKNQLGSNAAASGVGPRFRVPDGTLVARRRANAAPVRERDAMQRDRGDRVSFPVRDRGGVRAGGDRPDRAQPTAREPDRRGASGGSGGGRDRDAGRAAPERRGGGGGGGGGGWSAPRAPSGGDRGGRAAPSSRGNGGGGGGGGGNHGNSGGGARRRADRKQRRGRVLGAGLAFLGALCFAELTTRQPRAAGKYAFVREAFGTRAGFVVGWVEALGTNGVAIAAIGVAGGEFLVRLLGWPPARIAPLGAGLVALFTGINLVGVASGRWVQNVVTAAKLLALGGVVVIAFARGTGAGW